MPEIFEGSVNTAAIGNDVIDNTRERVEKQKLDLINAYRNEGKLWSEGAKGALGALKETADLHKRYATTKALTSAAFLGSQIAAEHTGRVVNQTQAEKYFTGSAIQQTEQHKQFVLNLPDRIYGIEAEAKRGVAQAESKIAEAQLKMREDDRDFAIALQKNAIAKARADSYLNRISDTKRTKTLDDVQKMQTKVNKVIREGFEYFSQQNEYADRVADRQKLIDTYDSNINSAKTARDSAEGVKTMIGGLGFVAGGNGPNGKTANRLNEVLSTFSATMTATMRRDIEDAIAIASGTDANKQQTLQALQVKINDDIQVLVDQKDTEIGKLTREKAQELQLKNQGLSTLTGRLAKGTPYAFMQNILKDNPSMKMEDFFDVNNGYLSSKPVENFEFYKQNFADFWAETWRAEDWYADINASDTIDLNEDGIPDREQVGVGGRRFRTKQEEQSEGRTTSNANNLIWEQ